MNRAGLLAFLFLASCGGADGGVTEVTTVDSESREETEVDSSADSEEPMFDTGTADAVAEATVDSASDTAAEADTKLSCTGSQVEPDDSLPSARPLKDINDCDGSGSKFSGTVGGSDIDYWTYKGSDNVGCAVDPTVVNHSASIRVCVFAQCGSGATEFKKCSKGTAFKLPSGIDGCCTDGPGTAELDYKCTLFGADDSADVYMRIDSPGATSCIPYDVDYHF